MIKLKTLKLKLFGRSKKEIYKDIHFLCLEISDILEDISEDLDDIHEGIQESLRLTLKVQEQCNEIIKIYESMQKRDEERIEKVKANERMSLGGQGMENFPTLTTRDIVADNIEDILDRIEKITDGFDKGKEDESI